MTVYRWDRGLTATLESPFISQGLWADAPGLDSVLARDHTGKIIIPGSQVRGLVRHVLHDMLGKGPKAEDLTQGDLDLWFGKGSGDAYQDDHDGSNPFKPDAAAVAVFADLICNKAEPKGSTITRIALDEHTGSVARGALQVLELPFALGEAVPFAGSVAFYGEAEEAKRFWRALAVAFKFIPALGGVKSSGFGHLAEPLAWQPAPKEGVTLISQTRTQPISLQERMMFDLEFLSPFLVDADFIGGNIFVGSEILPGAVIKGCLARKLKLAGKWAGLETALAKTTFSHALPVPADAPAQGCPRRAPFSLVEYQGRVYDCFNEADASFLEGEPVKYQIDWKYPLASGVNSAMGWPSVQRHVRTRTAIDLATQVVEDGKLFSYREVMPGGRRWRFTMTTPRGTGAAAQRELAEALLGGLDFVGKSDARANCSLAPDSGKVSMAASATYQGKPTWRITLQTPALLLDTLDFTRRPGQTSPPAIRELYQTYWSQLAKDALSHCGITLVDFLAMQKWEGGYRARRFRQKEGRYTPYLLTQPGSIFLLRLEGPAPTEQQAFFTKLVEGGLPVYFQGDIRRDSSKLWDDCPYIPQNGYGEVRADWQDARQFEGGVTIA